MTKSVKLIGAAMLLGSLLLASGCSSNGEITAADVRHNWSPELTTLTLSAEQHRVREWRTYDTNLRQVHDDLARLLLTERPLGLTPYIIPE
ncbi:MAG: hypothetical protein ACODAQ_08070 [Phycisphaeraceae bacterium]